MASTGSLEHSCGHQSDHKKAKNANSGQSREWLFEQSEVFRKVVDSLFSLLQQEVLRYIAALCITMAGLNAAGVECSTGEHVSLLLWL